MICECCGRVPGTEVIILPPYEDLPAEPFLACGECVVPADLAVAQ